MSARYRCVVADDHPAIIDAVWRFLVDEQEIELLGRADNGEQAFRLIDQERPDVAILDIRMPTLNGIESRGASTAARCRRA